MNGTQSREKHGLVRDADYRRFGYTDAQVEAGERTTVAEIHAQVAARKALGARRILTEQARTSPQVRSDMPDWYDRLDAENRSGSLLHRMRLLAEGENMLRGDPAPLMRLALCDRDVEDAKRRTQR